MKDYATYSPQDNKLRLYPAARLDSETYAQVKAQGFIWAAKQECFVAPMWTPQREDFLLSLVDCIEDEDQTLEERAEARASRFEGYSEKRAQEAQNAYDAVSRITEGTPLGQPILVGHHSEKHAQRDAEKIESGMRKTVKLFETSEYWQQRAKASIRHAKYKERPDVRFRRRKGLEADARKYQRYINQMDARIAYFNQPTLTEAQFLEAFNYASLGLYDGNGELLKWNYEAGRYDLQMPLADAAAHVVKSAEKSKAFYTRWLNHANNRIAYETTMLDGWEPVKVERKKKALAPLVNFKTAGALEMTAAEWKAHTKYDSFQVVAYNSDGKRADWGAVGDYRQRTRLSMMENDQRVFITDMPVKCPEQKEACYADAG